VCVCIPRFESNRCSMGLRSQRAGGTAQGSSSRDLETRLRWIAVAQILSHTVATAASIPTSTGCGFWVSMSGLLGSLAAIAWVAFVAPRYTLGAHVALSPLVGAVHLGLPVAMPMLLMATGLASPRGTSDVAYLEALWRTYKPMAAFTLNSAGQVALIAWLEKSTHRRRNMLMLTAFFDVLDSPLHHLLHRVVLPSAQVRPSVGHLVALAAGRAFLGLAAEWLAMQKQDPPRKSHPRSIVNDHHSALQLAAAQADGASSSVELSRCEAPPAAAAPTDSSRAAFLSYRSRLLKQGVSVKLHGVDHGSPAVQSRSMEDMIATLAKLVDERAQGMNVRASITNAALTIGCVALCCNLVSTRLSRMHLELWRLRVWARCNLPLRLDSCLRKTCAGGWRMTRRTL